MDHKKLGTLRLKPRSTMKKKNHTPEQIIAKLRKVEALTAEGATVAEAAKKVGASEQSIYRWKRTYVEANVRRYGPERGQAPQGAREGERPPGEAGR